MATLGMFLVACGIALIIEVIAYILFPQVRDYFNNIEE